MKWNVKLLGIITAIIIGIILITNKIHKEKNQFLTCGIVGIYIILILTFMIVNLLNS